MAQQEPHYTIIQELRESLVNWGFTYRDDWFADERDNCELLLDFLQRELKGRQVEAIRSGLDGDEGHATRITKLEDTITIVRKMIAELDGEGSLETTGIQQREQAPEQVPEEEAEDEAENEAVEDEVPQEETLEDEGGEQDMVVSDGE